MRLHLINAFLLLFTSALAGRIVGAEPNQTDVLETVRQHIKPLTFPLGDRLPILTWQSRGFPTGAEDGRIAEVQQLLMDRGLSPLCNPIATASKAADYIPVLKYRQDSGFPVCILPHGDPFVSQTAGPSYELPAVYLACTILFLLLGPGRLSLDALFFGRPREATPQEAVS